MTKYCGCINKENVYRNYSSNRKAISAYKMLAIKRNAIVTDISVKLDGHWSKIRWS